MSRGGTMRASLIERAAASADYASAFAPKERGQVEPSSTRAEMFEAPVEHAAPEALQVPAFEAHRSMPDPAPALRAADPRPVPRGPVAPVAHDMLAEAGFILPDMAPTALSEEFRVVKRQLLAPAMEPGASPALRRVLVTSARPDEGKTFCAINLALSLAREKGLDVLLVDADFAKPEILSLLGLPGGPGLTDILGDEGVRLDDCVIRTDIPNLSVLPAGLPSNETTELLASSRMKSLCEEWTASNKRVVVLDSSPVLAASSISVLAGLVGQAVVVVRADITGEHDLREAIALTRGCERIRLLLNAVELQPIARRFSGYYGQAG